ncbi:MAG: BlaI/MecI/CopY family transcriptional regulator [Phycisphaerales bacterium]
MTAQLDELGDLQRQILETIWSRREATVADVRESLAVDGRDLAYTTVLSTIQKLEKRGWLTHRTEGRTHVYRSARSREDAGRGSVRGLVERLFGGRSAVVMQHLVDDERLTGGELAELRAMIDARIDSLEPASGRPSTEPTDAQ